MAGSDVTELSCWDDWLAKTVKEVVKGSGNKDSTAIGAISTSAHHVLG
jgi:hypothetical protein